jgi:ubiquinone/menaquinone biosynthesis C-methylase UbiE
MLRKEAGVVTREPPSHEKQRGHRWFAALYDPLSKSDERGAMGRRRDELLNGVEGDVVEIGAGTGANFSHYSTQARIVAFEPDPFMLARAEKKLQELASTNIDVRQARAEELPLPDSSCDTAVSTLVLCTVADVPRALAEVKRVLRPSGELRFIEHVRHDSARGHVQDFIKPVWKWVAAGCYPNRRTEEAILQAGFEIVSLKREMLVPWLIPVITGVARRR